MLGVKHLLVAMHLYHRQPDSGLVDAELVESNLQFMDTSKSRLEDPNPLEPYLNLLGPRVPMSI